MSRYEAITLALRWFAYIWTGLFVVANILAALNRFQGHTDMGAVLLEIDGLMTGPHLIAELLLLSPAIVAYLLQRRR